MKIKISYVLHIPKLLSTFVNAYVNTWIELFSSGAALFCRVWFGI